MAAAGAPPQWLYKQAATKDTRTWLTPFLHSAIQAEVRTGLGDAKGAVAAYKRAVGEASSPDLALLQGLADALAADARQQEAVDFLSAQQPTSGGTGVDDVDLQLLIGKVNPDVYSASPAAADEDCSLHESCWDAGRCTPSGCGMMRRRWQSTTG